MRIADQDQRLSTLLARPRHRRSREGLIGVEVRIDGHDDPFVIHSTVWGADSRLKVTAYPLGQPKPELVLQFKDEQQRQESEQLGVIPGSAFKGTTYPPGTLHDLDASQVTIVGAWKLNRL